MFVTATEFRTNVGKYIEMAKSENIYIIKHGVPLVVLSACDDARKRIIDSLLGAYEYEDDLDDLLDERLREQ